MTGQPRVDLPPAVVVTFAHGNGDRPAVCRTFNDGMGAHDHAEQSVRAGHVTLLISPPNMWDYDTPWTVEEYKVEELDGA